MSMPSRARSGRYLRRLPALALIVLVFPVLVRADADKAEAARQLDFGVKMAQKGSWNEAAFRFGKAVKADPENAAAQNDLGVALESIGQFDKALLAYEKALQIDPRNSRMRENKDRLQAYLATRNVPKPGEKPGAEAHGKPEAAPKQGAPDPNAPPPSRESGGGS